MNSLPNESSEDLINKKGNLRISFTEDLLDYKEKENNKISNDTELNNNGGLKNIVIFYYTMANILLVMSDVSNKMFSNNYDHKYTMHFLTYRNFFNFLMLYGYFYYKNETPKNLFFIGSSTSVYMIRLFTTTFYLITIVLLFNNLKVAIVVVIINTSPVATFILSLYLLNEKFDKRKFIYTLICFFTLVVVLILNSLSYKDDVNVNKDSKIEENHILGYTIAPICILLGALYMIYSKLITYEFNSFEVNYLHSFWGGIITLVISILFYDYRYLAIIFDPFFFFVLLLNSIFFVLGSIYLQNAFESDDLGKNMYLLYSQIPMSILGGMIFFNEKLSILEYIGSLVIIITVYKAEN